MVRRLVSNIRQFSVDGLQVHALGQPRVMH